jgi:AcrR family transcriptional regulator
MDIPKQTFLNLNIEKQERILDAALNEFSLRSFEESKLSNIIKEAKIPRGSFYQYFEDKLDIYKVVFDSLGQKKMLYMSDLLLNNNKVPFLVLVKELYKTGVKFAFENPQAVKMTQLLLSSKGLAYKIIMKDPLKKAKDFYIHYIEEDIRLGIIDPSIDADILADIFVKMINDISLDELGQEDDKIDYENMILKFEKVINILEKGILTGEKNV